MLSLTGTFTVVSSWRDADLVGESHLGIKKGPWLTNKIQVFGNYLSLHEQHDYTNRTHKETPSMSLPFHVLVVLAEFSYVFQDCNRLFGEAAEPSIWPIGFQCFLRHK